MDVRQVTSLAKLLRDSGDKILNSEFKLTLSASLLKALNDSFSLITHESDTAAATGFQVVKPLITKSDVLEDLQLIYDFVQKTLSLCITNYPGEENFKEAVDLNRFRSLVKLEIQKFNINQICGIQKLRPQLQHLICVRCLNNVDDIIVYCGKDNSMGFVWNELRVADFSYNNLRKCDNSLEFVAYLQNLNLSHNLLTSVEAIKWLPHLKYLNLSFNRLTSLPIFHMESNRQLQVLIINNNLIEIIDTCKLEALTDFDLSNNCILDHSTLLPLSTFCALSYLNLSGNPLSCHPKHRENTAKYLHKNTSKDKFLLDFEPLSKHEKSLAGQIKSFNPLYSARSFTQINRTSGSSTPVRRSDRVGDSSGANSVESFKMDFNNLMKKSEFSKKSRIRIVDLDSSSNTDISEDNKNYLETKRKIEQLREKHGANWLQEQSSKKMVESVLGLESTSKGETENNITPEDLINELLTSVTTAVNGNINNGLALISTPINDSIALSIQESPMKVEKDNKSKEKIGDDNIKSNEENSGESSDDIKDTNVENNTIYESVQEEIVPKIDQFYPSNVNEEEQFSDPEGEEFFIAYVNNSTDEVFLTVSDDRIRERDVLNKKTLEKWSLKILESCDRFKSDTIRINFDTIKADRKERLYKLEEKRCKDLEKLLRDYLSSRELSEMNQVIYRCVQCLSKFSREKYKDPNTTLQCPECQSIFIVEINESPKTKSNIIAKPVSTFNKSIIKPSVEMFTQPGSLTKEVNEQPSTLLSDVNKNNPLQDQQQSTTQTSQNEKNPLEESASHSSIGKGVVWKQSNKPLSSAGSLNESSSCSKISQNSFDSNQSVAGSSSNERDNDFNNMGFSNSKYYNDSEVEILSNPSQSSIEVLDGFQGSRKTSEERRISRIPSLETIEDNSIRNFSFKIGSDMTTADLISGIDMTNNDNTKTLTSKDSTAQFLKKEIKNTLSQQQKNNEKLSEEIEHNDKINNKPMGIIEKKISTGHLNLTESSSSGSVTDSVCTSYEQDAKNKSNNDLTSSESKEDDSKDEKELPLMSNILGGLFQSTYKLMLGSQKSASDSDTSSNLQEKFKYNYNDYSDADHRLKFFFINKFNQNEYFKGIVKGSIFDGNTLRYYEAIVVMSTNKFYIMEIIGSEDDDPSKWLKEILSVSIDRMEALQILPFKAGLSLTIRNYSEKFLLILQDILRTDSLMLFFANNPLPGNCSLEYQVSEIVMTKLLSVTNNNKIKMFAILNSFEIKRNNDDNDTEIISPAGFYITDDYLYITKSDLSWLSENLDKNIELRSIQKMCNLVEVKKFESNILEIYFTDERIDSHDLWKCEFGTQENTETSLNAIEQSWEKIFGVPLLNN